MCKDLYESMFAFGNSKSGMIHNAFYKKPSFVFSKTLKVLEKYIKILCKDVPGYFFINTCYSDLNFKILKFYKENGYTTLDVFEQRFNRLQSEISFFTQKVGNLNSSFCDPRVHYELVCMKEHLCTCYNFVKATDTILDEYLTKKDKIAIFFRGIPCPPNYDQLLRELYYQK